MMSCTNRPGVVHNFTTPLTRKVQPIIASDDDPYQTTFVQADTTTFKQVVQMLTGSAETVKQASNTIQDPSHCSLKGALPPNKVAPKKQGFKLYERRNSLSNCPMVITRMPGGSSFAHKAAYSPRYKPEILSPSALDFPSKLLLSPVKHLSEAHADKSPLLPLKGLSEEEKAIAEKGFYLHPSPGKSAADTEPKLLQLFPVTFPQE